MRLDRGAPRPVAWLTLIAIGCGPTVKVAEPPAEPGPVAQGQPRPLNTDAAGRRIVVGEMCPQGAGGRPAVAPLVMRGIGWTDAVAEITATIERGSVPRFTVFGVDGKPAGMFDTVGVADIGAGVSVATGTYVGAGACTYGVATKPGPDALDTRGEDPRCGAATRGCGIAVGEITHPDEPIEVPRFTTGGACMNGNELAVDIDGDGRIESFPIAGVLDNIRAPAAEWTASPTVTATCTPTFHVYDLKLLPEPRPGKPAEKGLVTVDILGVVDLDADGRREVIVGMRFPTVRTIVVYSATSSSQRLEKAGEAPSFAR